jgi:hypothetical protein
LGWGSTQLAKKIGKLSEYVLHMAETTKLLCTLETHGMKAEYYASDKSDKPEHWKTSG